MVHVWLGPSLDPGFHNSLAATSSRDHSCELLGVGMLLFSPLNVTIDALNLRLAKEVMDMTPDRVALTSIRTAMHPKTTHVVY